MRRTYSFLILVILFCSGCGSTSLISRTSEFAQTGIAFSDNLDPVLDQSLEAKVRANSLTLRLGRESLLELCGSDASCIQTSQDQLADELDTDTKNLQKRVKFYRDFRAHSEVLRNYFQTLSSLASSEQPKALGQSAQQLVSQAVTLRDQIEGNTQAPSTDVGDVPKILVSQIASTFRSKALEKVLKATAPQISTELELHSQLLDGLTEQTSSDLELAFQLQDDKDINEPFFASTDQLPADWADKRLAMAQRGLDLTSVGAARKAAGTLKTAFEALVENRLDASSLGGLIQDMNNLATLVLEVERVRNEDKGEES